MKKITILLFIIFFISCSKNKKTTENNISVSPKKNIQKDIVWKDFTIRNLSFQLPSNFVLNVTSSKVNKKVYLAEEENLGLTIDIENLPSGYENSKIHDIVSSPNDFGLSVNHDNKNLFNDFKLLSSEFSYIGNIESVLVTQSSTKISGSNISMLVKSHFTIASPYYYSITFTYPGNSYSGQKIINKIMKSFKFKDSIDKGTSDIIIQPNLKKSQEWLLNKLSSKIIHTRESDIIGTTKIYFYSTDYKNVNIIDNNLIFVYRYTAESPSYKNKFKNLTNYKVIIPFDKIVGNDFDNYRTYNGECEFVINTNSNSISKINLDNGEKEFTSSYKFKFDCSEEQNLGSRLNRAIMHIKNITPNFNKKRNELF